MADLSVTTLRGLFRSYRSWHSEYESTGVETLTDAEGVEWNLFDVQYLLDNLGVLPLRQAQAIRLFLVDGMKESDVAVLMGILPSNPIGMYASSGMERLIEMVTNGALPRFYVVEGVYR